MNDQLPLSSEQMKRRVAYKMRIGNILAGKQVFEGERLKGIEDGGKNVSRINLIANVVDKYVQEGEKKFGSLTLDDSTGQIKVKSFGEEVDKFSEFNQGDTVLVVGLLRFWNDEIYVTPEIMKKKDSAFLLVRKLEMEAEQPKTLEKEQIAELKDKILSMVKEAEKEEGIDIDKIILELKEPPNIINAEIKKLLEGGAAYEPRPGRLRYLGW
ncbi:MAG: OB-fold nucleic acid binding domain-containing protein [Nanoarchaeota archaeon]|nr:OB-fold nucleic acid binding domain-containing protein [Nanoarchaeota archaeon]MBU1102970.1 OB-fold nucleic acid binding domain-containing protein [Nanoarchaeota archaeon]